jgi:NAD(P)-dependent dehydrogenase (short-subunit alcohol dehydrogenase family)
MNPPLMRCTAKELAEYGITVNAYAPGFINTDMGTRQFLLLQHDSYTNFKLLLCKMAVARLARL